MAEEVSTGGLVRFRREKGEKLELDDARRAEIEKGYEQYYARRADEERRKKIIFWVIGIILFLIVCGAGYFVMR